MGGCEVVEGGGCWKMEELWNLWLMSKLAAECKLSIVPWNIFLLLFITDCGTCIGGNPR